MGTNRQIIDNFVLDQIKHKLIRKRADLYTTTVILRYLFYPSIILYSTYRLLVGNKVTLPPMAIKYTKLTLAYLIPVNIEIPCLLKVLKHFSTYFSRN